MLSRNLDRCKRRKPSSVEHDESTGNSDRDGTAASSVGGRPWSTRNRSPQQRTRSRKAVGHRSNFHPKKSRTLGEYTSAPRNAYKGS